MMPADKTTPDPAAPRLFADYLRQLDRGRIHEDLSEEFHELVKAVAETGKGGKVTFTLTVKPSGKHGPETCTVETQIKTDIPKPGRNPTLFYWDEHFRLTRRDPRQGDIEDTIRGLDGGRRE